MIMLVAFLELLQIVCQGVSVSPSTCEWSAIDLTPWWMWGGPQVSVRMRTVKEQNSLDKRREAACEIHRNALFRF